MPLSVLIIISQMSFMLSMVKVNTAVVFGKNISGEGTY